MAYQIEISPTAVADIESIFLWIKEDSPENVFPDARKYTSFDAMQAYDENSLSTLMTAIKARCQEGLR